MNLTEEKYNRYAIVRDMMETPDFFRNFNPSAAQRFLKKIRSKKGLLLTGEGSSRIFPAKRAITALRRTGSFFPVITEGSTQAEEYPLSDYAVFAASNSGNTREVVHLFYTLEKRNHDALFALTLNKDNRLAELATETHILSCGKEEASAATKSVMEQGLFYDSVIRGLMGQEMSGLDFAAEKIEEALTLQIEPEIIEKLKMADVIYFAGRNNGVAEELALKTIGITGKKGVFLEGTIAVHGIQNIMQSDDILIWIEPFQNEEDRFREHLEKAVGISIFAISCEHTPFKGMRIPFGGQYAEYVKLAAGWNLLVETGIALGKDIDNKLNDVKEGDESDPAQ
jgi:glutamine---fructose-6-phosphate transaminase (isomerizing)